MTRVVAATVLFFAVSACADDRASSDLQFRHVVSGDADHCADRDANPDPEAGATLGTEDEECFELGPSELTVTTAETSRNDAGVLIRLAEGESESLRVLTEKYSGERLGLVMFGKVLIAPEIEQAIEGGEVLVSGLSSDMLDDVQEALKA